MPLLNYWSFEFPTFLEFAKKGTPPKIMLQNNNPIKDWDRQSFLGIAVEQEN